MPRILFEVFNAWEEARLLQFMLPRDRIMMHFVGVWLGWPRRQDAVPFMKVACLKSARVAHVQTRCCYRWFQIFRAILLFDAKYEGS